MCNYQVIYLRERPSAHAPGRRWKRFAMATDSSELLGLVEEFVSGKADSSAADIATGM